MRARVRKDLIEAGQFPPLWSMSYQPVNLKNTNLKVWEEFESFQPEAWNNDEINTMLIDFMGSLFFGNSIDFDFFE